MRFALRLAALLSAVVVVSCATAPNRSNSGPFAAENPVPGLARLYILRPGVFEKLTSDSPTLSLNDTAIFELRIRTYTAVTLRPGKYHLKIKPGLLESSTWLTEIAFDTEPDRVYFLAIWNDVERSPGVRFLNAAPLFPVLPMPGTIYRDTVRLEFVEQDQAVPVMSEMSFVRPKEVMLAPEP